MARVALITGISGQDGHYLASDRLAAGFRVVGTTRDIEGARAALGTALSAHVELVDWDLVDQECFVGLLREYAPSQIYNLAALTSGESMDHEPERVTDINGVSVLRMVEAVRRTNASTRFCQASSSEVFAASGISPQNERTPRVPRSVYGAAKILADNILGVYRQRYGLFCCSAFLFNHESPHRGEGFVTKKIIRAAVQIKAGRQRKLSLGNLSAVRDWGFAGDYTRAMTLMLQAGEPKDYVIATGIGHTVADFCEHAFRAVSLDYRDYVEVDPNFYRPAEPVPILGDSARARRELGWAPTVSFGELIRMMVDAEVRAHNVDR